MASYPQQQHPHPQKNRMHSTQARCKRDTRTFVQQGTGYPVRTIYTPQTKKGFYLRLTASFVASENTRTLVSFKEKEINKKLALIQVTHSVTEPNTQNYSHSKSPYFEGSELSAGC